MFRRWHTRADRFVTAYAAKRLDQYLTPQQIQYVMKKYSRHQSVPESLFLDDNLPSSTVL